MKGVSAKHMRQFYISVAIPKMLYAADLFLIPGSEVGKGTKGFISKLVRIQRQATLHITGGPEIDPDRGDRRVHRHHAISHTGGETYTQSHHQAGNAAQLSTHCETHCLCGK